MCSAERVDDGEHAERPPVIRPVCDKIIAPDIARTLRSQLNPRAVVEPQPPAPRLPLRNLQPLPAPDPLDPLGIHRPARTAQQGGDPATGDASPECRARLAAAPLRRQPIRGDLPATLWTAGRRRRAVPPRRAPLSGRPPLPGRWQEVSGRQRVLPLSRLTAEMMVLSDPQTLNKGPA